MINDNTAYLVYFNCRGSGHYYRYVIYEIGIPYQQIHINSDGTMPQQIKKFNIVLNDIPCIIYEGRVIKQLYPTLRYICRKFNRLDLLGNNIYQQTRISELYSKNAKNKSSIIATFLKNVMKIKKQPEQLKKIKIQMLKQINDSPGSSEGLALMYSETGGYLFNHLTIADFLFYENCFYFSSFFSDVGRKKLPILFAYKNFFEKTDFYKKNKQKIESFKFVIPEFDDSVNQGFKLMMHGYQKQNQNKN